MKRTLVCKVVGRDSRHWPVFHLVEATSLYEAAAKAMDEMIRAGHAPSDLQVEIQEPGKCYQITPIQMSRWVVGRSPDERDWLTQLKRRLHDVLKEHLQR